VRFRLLLRLRFQWQLLYSESPTDRQKIGFAPSTLRVVDEGQEVAEITYYLNKYGAYMTFELCDRLLTDKEFFDAWYRRFKEKHSQCK
jgi:hypothetical protein